MSSKIVASRMRDDTVSRLEKVAAADRRSVSIVVAMMVEQALPEWEARVLAQAPAQPPKGRAKT